VQGHFNAADSNRYSFIPRLEAAARTQTADKLHLKQYFILTVCALTRSSPRLIIVLTQFGWSCYDLFKWTAGHETD
jgi:hypothetical protein